MVYLKRDNAAPADWDRVYAYVSSRDLLSTTTIGPQHPLIGQITPVLLARLHDAFRVPHRRRCYNLHAHSGMT